jgi:intracellular septation protein
MANDVRSTPATVAQAPGSEHLVKTAIDLVPLVLFFLGNLIFGIYIATALCMAATLVSIIVSRVMLKRLPVMAMVTGAGVLVFGGLTLWLHDETFFKIKPTIVNALFASALLGGLVFGQLFVKSLLGEAIQLQDAGWRKLQWRWGLFFIALAILNEIVWRNFSTNLWAMLKIANIPLTFAFMLSQVNLLKRFALDPQSEQVPVSKRDE